MAGSDDSPGKAGNVTDRLDSAFSVLRAGAIAGGAGLVGGYALPWVAVTGETASGGTGTISGRELELVPEVAAVLGLVTIAVAVLRWTTWTQAGVLVAAGFLGVLGALPER